MVSRPWRDCMMKNSRKLGRILAASVSIGLAGFFVPALFPAARSYSATPTAQAASGQAAFGQAASGQAASGNDDAAAFSRWRAVAESGDAEAAGIVGNLYDLGQGVPRDPGEALTWYRRAAADGNVSSMLNVAVMLDSGRAGPPDRVEAARWYELAAAKGSARAAYNLATMYDAGDGVSRDPAKSLSYYRMAALGGIGEAKLRAANPALRKRASAGQRSPAAASASTFPSTVPMHEAALLPPPKAVMSPLAPPPEAQDRAAFVRRAQGVMLDRQDVSSDPDAIQEFTSVIPALGDAAKQGNPLAQYDLGYLYEYGIGLGADPVVAFVNYVRAASGSGNPRVTAAAKQGARAVGTRLTEEQHDAAQKLLISGP